mmetsp:Transcript_26571/g.63277  ORF Transcript_26571/g.63277 Transcript_26571/m.63277 type:complete len:269 (+) Transcript_26571:483-1289(+)
MTAPTQTFIDNITKYLVENYDGQPHEWASHPTDMLDGIFYDDLRMTSFGHSSSQQLSGAIIHTKESRLQDERKFVSFGTFYYGKGGTEFHVLDDRHIRWKASFHKSKVTADRDYMVEIGDDGKAVAIEPYNPVAAIKPLYRQFIAIFDGTTTATTTKGALTPSQNEIIDALFHENCLNVVVKDDDVAVVWDNVAKFKHIVSNLKTENEESSSSSSSKGEFAPFLIDNIVTVQDGKIIKVVPHQQQSGELLTNLIDKVEHKKKDQKQPA